MFVNSLLLHKTYVAVFTGLASPMKFHGDPKIYIYKKKQKKKNVCLDIPFS